MYKMMHARHFEFYKGRSFDGEFWIPLAKQLNRDQKELTVMIDGEELLVHGSEGEEFHIARKDWRMTFRDPVHKSNHQ